MVYTAYKNADDWGMVQMALFYPQKMWFSLYLTSPNSDKPPNGPITQRPSTYGSHMLYGAGIFTYKTVPFLR